MVVTSHAVSHSAQPRSREALLNPRVQSPRRFENLIGVEGAEGTALLVAWGLHLLQEIGFAPADRKATAREPVSESVWSV